MTASRRDYLAAWRWLRLGVRVPLRLDLEAPEPLQCAFMAFGNRRQLNSLAVPLRRRAWYVFPPAAEPAALVPAGLPVRATAPAFLPEEPVQLDFDEPESSPAQELAFSLAACVRAVDDFYRCPVSSAHDLHEALRAAKARARRTLVHFGYEWML